MGAFLILGPTTIDFRGRHFNCGPTILGALPLSPVGQSEYELERGDACVLAMLKRLGVAMIVVSAGVAFLVVSSRRPRVPTPPRPDIGSA